MNLENLNVVELNAQEMQNTDGGFLGILLTVAVVALVIWAATDDNPRTESYHNGERVGN